MGKPPKVEYTDDQIKAAYLAWTATRKAEPSWAELKHRESKWNEYCDVRDGVPLGTYAAQDKEREEIRQTRIVAQRALRTLVH